MLSIIDGRNTNSPGDAHAFELASSSKDYGGTSSIADRRCGQVRLGGVAVAPDTSRAVTWSDVLRHVPARYRGVKPQANEIARYPNRRGIACPFGIVGPDSLALAAPSELRWAWLFVGQGTRGPRRWAAAPDPAPSDTLRVRLTDALCVIENAGFWDSPGTVRPRAEFFLVEKDSLYLLIDAEWLATKLPSDTLGWAEEESLRVVHVVGPEGVTDRAFYDHRCRVPACTQAIVASQTIRREDSVASAARRPPPAVQAELDAARLRRIQFAFQTMRDFNARHYELSVEAVGEHNAILRIEYALAGDIFVSRVERMESLFDGANRLGFREIWVTDGWRGFWRWELP